MPNISIRGYHIHVYCNPEQTPIAQEVREAMIKDLPVIEGAGPVRNRPVGPHPLPMFEAWFQPEGISEVLPWILANRRGLPVLIHPLTGNDYIDHAEHAIWIGEKLELNLEMLKD
jgi:aromatic ring-cleaving dioxygenase